MELMFVLLVMIAATHGLSLEERTERQIQRRHEIDLLELEWSQEAAALAATDRYEYEGLATPLEWIRITCKMTGPQPTGWRSGSRWGRCPRVCGRWRWERSASRT